MGRETSVSLGGVAGLNSPISDLGMLAIISKL